MLMPTKQLSEQTTRHAVYLEGLKTGEANKFASFLQRIDVDLRQRLSGTELTDFSRTRLDRLLVQVREDLHIVFTDYREELSSDLVDLAEYEAEFEASSVTSVLEHIDLVIPGPKQVKSAVFSQPLSVRGASGGKLLKPFIKDWTISETDRITGAIRQGYFEGQTNSQIKRVLRGSRVSRFTDGILSITSRNADAVVRTAVQHAASVARVSTWKANRDVVSGYQWLSTLDGRTSSQCRSLDGTVYEFDKGPLPPIHIRCRSTTLAEIRPEFAAPVAGLRASMAGPVPNQSYYQWLGNQSPRFQDSVIGPTRGKLLRDGGLSADRFSQLNLGRNFKPLTLDEMKARSPLVFERALGTD